MIPRNSVFGFLEIKKTDYTNGLESIDSLFTNKDLYLPDYAKDNYFAIICINRNYKIDCNSELTKLMKKYNNKIICLFNIENDNQLKLNIEAIKQLINEIAKLKNLYSKEANNYQLSNITSIN